MSTDLLTRDRLAGRQGGVWAYVSPSRLGKWLSCPLAFRIQYIDGIWSPTTPSLFLGKTVHASLEAFYRNRQLGITLTLAELSHRLSDSWGQMAEKEGMKFQSTAEEDALKKQAMDLVSTYLQQVPADEPRPLAVEVAMEAPLVDPETGEDLGIPLVGIVDLILDDKAGPTIIDFKTAARSAEPLEVIHEIQLTSYAFLLRHVSTGNEAGLEIRSLVKTKAPKIETHRYLPRTDAHFRRLFAVVREYLDALDRGQFNFRPSWGCGMCDFRDSHCRRWKG